MAELVADELRRLDATDAAGPVMVQSFEPAVLRDLRALLGDDGPRMIQLVHDDAAGDRMVTRAGCARSPPTRRASAPAASVLLPQPPAGDLVEEAHRAA